MMRANSTQKTYDEAFLACSTAVYFESQNNEAEALRQWRAALDQIYYHNAHRIPSSYRPASQTDKALQDSLHQLELQCKERVDLLEALQKSREDTTESLAAPVPPAAAADSNALASPAPAPPIHGQPYPPNNANGSAAWLGGGTVPPVGYNDLYRPPLPLRPSLQPRKSSGADSSRNNSMSQPPVGASLSPGPPTQHKDSRTPSPEKKGRMLRTLRPGGKDGSRPSSSRLPSSMRPRPPAAAKAATQAWGTNAATTRPVYSSSSASKESLLPPQAATSRASFERSRSGFDSDRPSTQPPSQDPYQPQAPFYFRSGETSSSAVYAVPPPSHDPSSKVRLARKDVPSPASQRESFDLGRVKSNQGNSTGVLAYRNEYPSVAPDFRTLAASAATRSWNDLESERYGASRDKLDRGQALPPPSSNSNRGRTNPRGKDPLDTLSTDDTDEAERKQRRPRRRAKAKDDTVRADLPPTPTSDAGQLSCSETESDEWKARVRGILKNLPRGVDESAAKQILNDIVIQGDEVHWDDVAGLDIAKSALKETVVYPFLRPDLFMGLREPARGMLLFGPPGTGKTMLARTVATESKSTFFAISASSLTSKFLGESEKLVRALFALAKLLAPSIIFVDEIDSLLSSRSGSEHEATRRIKTEFLIQWSDLAKAAAGREQSERDKERGDASRVLVLAATNLPWAIDEAARRRFVRRQYIPLPEDHVRKAQLKRLMSHQKHELNEDDMDRLVALTDGFSGSDITALAKDAAMGPLRSLGEKLLHMTMDEIRPMRYEDFEASLSTIRPSVSKQGLKQFEDWAREFGERGG
ncbi:AAA-domain-containing protein [Melanomma pulvis-pyrius CBS 109.77]|uniref:AAA-domain-containing protein n=1 Tax=Melanomma pulvis-pyrius CBS 109.77 TaxID=1314802 RepID=A0A6A6WXR5_9PLEO|nr:AAA-domain-containing protein [Melanomma pulvis-pyrius CBS 109.77]